MNFHLNPALFSQYRSVLMGVSIIWIFIFHSKAVGISIYDEIQKFGWAGVDIFVNVLFPASGNQYKCLPLWQKTKVTKLCQ